MMMMMTALPIYGDYSLQLTGHTDQYMLVRKQHTLINSLQAIEHYLYEGSKTCTTRTHRTRDCDAAAGTRPINQFTTFDIRRGLLATQSPPVLHY